MDTPIACGGAGGPRDNENVEIESSESYMDYLLYLIELEEKMYDDAYATMKEWVKTATPPPSKPILILEEDYYTTDGNFVPEALHRKSLFLRELPNCIPGQLTYEALLKFTKCVPTLCHLNLQLLKNACRYLEVAVVNISTSDFVFNNVNIERRKCIKNAFDLADYLCIERELMDFYLLIAGIRGFPYIVPENNWDRMLGIISARQRVEKRIKKENEKARMEEFKRRFNVG